MKIETKYFLVIILVLFPLITIPLISASNGLNYEFVLEWGTFGTGEAQFWNPYGVAVDSSDNILVTDVFNNRVQKFNSTGGFILEWGGNGTGDGQFDLPWGIAVDSSDNVYVADLNNNRVQKFNSTGGFILEWGTLGTGDGQFDGPAGVVVDSSDNILVTDVFNNRVQKFNSTGGFILEWGTLGTGDGQFNATQGVAVDSSDNIFVTDVHNNRVQKFNSTGGFILEWGTLGTGDGQFDGPAGVAVDSSDNIFVADFYNHRVQKFRPPDTTAPTITIVSPENNANYAISSIHLNYTANENVSWIGHSLDEQANETVTGNTTLIDLLDGSHSVVVYANDTAGNMGASGIVYFTVDTASPDVSIISPENITYGVADVPLNLTANESTSWIGYSLDEQTNVTVTGNTTLIDLLDGSHSVVVYANDTAGNMGASGIVYFTVDTTPPNITNVYQTPTEDNVLPTDEVKVNVTITDEISGVKQVILNYTNGNGTWITAGMTNLEGNIWSATIPSFPDSTNVTYIITAEDNANNIITTEELGYEYQYDVIPEFPSLIILPLFMIATFIATIIYKRRHTTLN